MKYFSPGNLKGLNDIEKNMLGPTDREHTQRDTLPPSPRKNYDDYKMTNNKPNNYWQVPASRQEIIKNADLKPASYFKPPKF